MNTNPKHEELQVPLEDWVTQNIPPGWEEWEWHKFLCATARIYLVVSSHQLGLTVPQMIDFISMPLGQQGESLAIQ